MKNIKIENFGLLNVFNHTQKFKKRYGLSVASELEAFDLKSFPKN
jgi:hypothetical protein